MNDSPRIRLDSRTPGAAWTCRPGEPALVLECEAATRHALLRNQHGIIRMWDDPLAALDWMPQHLDEIGSADARWIGYLGYDLVRLFETLPSRAVDDLQMPLFAFTLHHVPVDLPWSGRTYEPQPNRMLDSNFSRESFLDAVNRAQDCIASGEISQVHLSQRFTAALADHPSQIYERLRRQSPATHGAYLDHLDYALICNSSESFALGEPASGSFVQRLRSGFPPDRVIGEPKMRAMEIIEELEPTRRGPYCGAIGYLAPGGRMEFNIAIRTMIVRDGLVHIPVGGSIVADSDPPAEYEQTLVKAQAMFAALGVTRDDLVRTQRRV